MSTLKGFLTEIATPGDDVHRLVVAPNELGLLLLLVPALAKATAPEDIHVHDAAGLTKEKARQLEHEAHLAPRGSSAKTVMFIHSAAELPYGSVGPLLKVMEEARQTQFIIQTQALTRKLATIASRSNVVRLPFLSAKAVLGNMKLMRHDAATAERLKLYDGTLGGTIRALSMKDTLVAIRRELEAGPRGTAGLFSQTLLPSIAMMPALSPHLTAPERIYLARQDTEDRRKIALTLAMARKK